MQNGEVLPTMTRSGEFEVHRGKQKIRLGRMFAVNSYYFYVLICPKEMREKSWRKLIENLPSVVPGAIRLSRMKHSILLRASNIDVFTANKDFASKFQPAFQSWKMSKQK